MIRTLLLNRSFLPHSQSSVFSCHFVSKPSPSSSDSETFNRDWIHKAIQNDPRIEKFLASSLSIPRILVELKQNPKLAFEFFKWSSSRNGVKHTIESYCIVAHILFSARMYHDANCILREMVLSKESDVFDVLWFTRNVCVRGFGVFDALFQVLICLGKLEEAFLCFSKMKRFRVFPNTRSCDTLLHRFAKLRKVDEMKSFFKDMIQFLSFIIKGIKSYFLAKSFE